MKNKYIIYLVFSISILVSGNKAFSQKYPVATSGEKGIIVFAGNDLQKGMQYVIEKKETSQGSYTPLTILSKPTTFVEFKSLLLHYSTLITSININDDAIIQKAWEELNKSTSDKLVFGNIPAVTLASGMAFYDTAVSANSSYRYKVSVLKNGKVLSGSESEPVTYSNQKIANSITLNYLATDEKHVFIEWKILGMPKPSNFEVYRSIVSKTDFSNTAVIKGFRSSGDTLILIVKDTLVTPNENYSYYIQAKDIFRNAFEPSEKVRVSAGSNAGDPIVLKLTTASNEKKRAIGLNFIISAAPEIRGVSIERSEDFDGNYTLLANIPATDSSYFDKTAIPFKSYYYRLIIHTLNGKTYPSANVSGFLSVNQILMPPFNIKSNETKTGVDLSWENSEPNIIGFVVYRCEGYKGTLEQISPVIRPKDLLNGSYTDSLVEAKKIYSYSVKSVDKLMTESPFSDTVTSVPLKNATPPPTPTRLKAKPSSTEIMLTWDDMYRGEPMLIGYNVYRKKGGEKDDRFEKLNSKLLSNQNNYFVDSALTVGSSWVYSVESIDIFDHNSGKSAPIETALITPKPVSPTGIRLYNQEEGVFITWDEPMNTDLKDYRLFRIEGNEKPKLIGTFKPGITSALDKTVKSGTLYVYYLISIDQYNGESEVMNEVSIRRK